MRDFDPAWLEELARFKAETPIFWQEFVGLKMPVAILHGEASEYLTSEHAERMAAAISHGRVVHVQQRCYPLLLDDPSSLAAIRAILAEAGCRSGMTPSVVLCGGHRNILTKRFSASPEHMEVTALTMKFADTETFDFLKDQEEYAHASGEPGAEGAELASIGDLVQKRRYLAHDAMVYTVAYMVRPLDVSRLQTVIESIKAAIDHEKKLAECQLFERLRTTSRGLGRNAVPD